MMVFEVRSAGSRFSFSFVFATAQDSASSSQQLYWQALRYTIWCVDSVHRSSLANELILHAELVA
jgi:hypothetical protein